MSGQSIPKSGGNIYLKTLDLVGTTLDDAAGLDVDQVISVFFWSALIAGPATSKRVAFDHSEFN